MGVSTYVIMTPQEAKGHMPIFPQCRLLRAGIFSFFSSFIICIITESSRFISNGFPNLLGPMRVGCARAAVQYLAPSEAYWHVPLRFLWCHDDVCTNSHKCLNIFFMKLTACYLVWSKSCRISRFSWMSSLPARSCLEFSNSGESDCTNRLEKFPAIFVR